MITSKTFVICISLIIHMLMSEFFFLFPSKELRETDGNWAAKEVFK